MENDNKIKKQLISEVDKLKQIIEGYEESKPSLGKLDKVAEYSSEQYRTLMNTAPFGIMTLDEDGTIISCNKKILDFLGKSEKEVVGKNFTKIEFLGKEDMHRYIKIFAYALSGKEGISFEISGQNKNGDIFYGEVFYGLVKRNGDVKAVQILINDITKRKEAEEKLNFLRFHDELTGLFNRAYFEEEAKRLDTERQLPLSFVIGDVNGLKLINDAFGSDEGDKILKIIAKAIKECCRREDIVSRWGEDEFAILLPKTSAEYSRKVMSRVKEICKKNSRGKTKFEMAMGSATKQDKDQDFQGIVKDAKDEMYKNKLFEAKSVPDSVISSLVDSLMEESYETREHGKRVRKLALKLGHTMGLPKSKLDELSILADLHDLGKIAIPDDIVTKRDKLSDKDWKILRSYPEIGYNIAKSSYKYSNIAEYILTHHERWDGTGYPQGLKGEDIPIVSRITAIADAYDVMRSGRFYKRTLTKKEAIEELEKSSGSQFDPQLIKKFIEILEEE
jgi:diguanylate cyclase (GGDEF)-like protein/PAS domain S-box-containing protein